MSDAGGVRADKWLWAARFFKTRALAARACELGRVQLSGQPCKPARNVRPGDQLRITTEGGDFEVAVRVAGEQRGPAAVAQTFYEESPESREQRAALAAQRRAEFAAFGAMPAPSGRPSKRDRRRIHRFRGDG